MSNLWPLGSHWQNSLHHTSPFLHLQLYHRHHQISCFPISFCLIWIWNLHLYLSQTCFDSRCPSQRNQEILINWNGLWSELVLLCTLPCPSSLLLNNLFMWYDFSFPFDFLHETPLISSEAHPKHESDVWSKVPNIPFVLNFCYAPIFNDNRSHVPLEFPTIPTFAHTIYTLTNLPFHFP